MTTWTKEMIEKLDELWRKGNSASVCANELNVAFNTSFSRSAILGKMHRAGKSRTKKSKNRLYKKPKNPGNRAYMIARRLHGVVERSDIEAKAVDEAGAQYDQNRISVGLTSFSELAESGQCRWPIGDPRERPFGFCGAGAPAGPYCTHHAQRAVDVTPRKRGKSRPWTWQTKRKALTGETV